jgi:hypothetical protein
MVIDVLRSPENAIPTAARIRAFELLYRCFDLDVIASSFERYNLEFKLPYSAKNEPVEDMIPRSFMQIPEEKGGIPHNDLFFQNIKIREIFRIR